MVSGCQNGRRWRARCVAQPWRTLALLDDLAVPVGRFGFLGVEDGLLAQRLLGHPHEAARLCEGSQA